MSTSSGRSVFEPLERRMLLSVTPAIDQGLLTPIDELAPTYYQSLGNLSSDTRTEPSTIRVLRTATSEVQVVPFNDYVRNVLPNEWPSSYGWPAEAYKAGAVSAKMFGWEQKEIRTDWQYDVRDDIFDQVYVPNSAQPNTDSAVHSVRTVGMEREDGQLFLPQYWNGRCDVLNSTGTGANLRPAPGTNNTSITFLNNGTRVYVIDNGENYVSGYRWFQVAVGGVYTPSYVGYVAADYLKGTNIGSNSVASMEGRESQYGTVYWANQSWDFQAILNYFFNGSKCTGYQNISFFNVSTAVAPTLAVTSPNGGEIWQTGTSYTVNWSISGDTSSINYQRVALSIDGGATFPSAWQTVLGSSDRSFSFTPDSSQVSTSAVIRVRAMDAAGYIQCWDLSDAPFTIRNPDTIPPTVNVFSVTPDSVVAGNSFTISYTVSDTGGSGLKQVELWRTNDPTGTSGWNEVVSVRRSLSGNGPVSGTFSDGSALSPGTYLYGIHVVDNAGNWSTERDAGLSPKTVTVQEPLAELRGNTFDSAEPLTAGQAFNVTFTLDNNGGAAAGGFWVDFYLSSDITISTSDKPLGDYYVSGLPAGSCTMPLTKSLTLPGVNDAYWSGDGTYYIGMVVDSRDNVSETDESNNRNRGEGIDRDAVSISGTQKADLRGWDCYAPTSAYWGDTITVQGQVRNDAAGSAGSFTQKFYLSADTTWGDADDYYLGSYSHGSLAGSTYGPDFNVNLTLPGGPPHAEYPTRGTYYIGMKTDANGSVSESNETNNGPGSYSKEYDWDDLVLGPRGNVELTLYRISDTSGTANTSNPGATKALFVRGETVRVTLKADNTNQFVPVKTVLNIRNPDNSTWAYDSHTASQDNSYDSPLNNGETDYYSFDWTIPAGARLGAYDILGAIRDYNNWDLVYDTTLAGRNNDFGPGDTLLDQFTVAANHAPTNIDLSDNTVAENQSVGTVVGMLSGTDPDPGQSETLTFVLVSGYGDNSQFSIDPATKQLKTAAVFNYEATSNCTIKVRSTDTASPALTYDETFTINVTNINEQPTDIALSNNSVAENQLSGTVIGVLSGTDPDAGQSETLTFSLVSGYGDNSQFSIDPATKKLKTAAVFDYETQNSYNIKVRATDSGNPALSYDETFAITVTDIDDVAPAVTAAAINDGLAQRSKITSIAITFSEEVTLSAGALSLHNDTTGEDFDLSTVPFNATTCTWDTSDVALTDGYYTGTLAAAGVEDTAGNPMASDYEFTFHVLKCDANGDAKVDGGDLAIWQQHYDPLGKNPNTPGMGDWTGDGKVDGGDLALWQQRYNPIGLPAPMKAGATPMVAEAKPAYASEPTITPLATAEVSAGSSGSESAAVGDVLGNEFLCLSTQGDAKTDAQPPTSWEVTLPQAEGTALSAVPLKVTATPMVAEAKPAYASEPTITPLATAEAPAGSSGSPSGGVGDVLGNEFLYLSDHGDAETDAQPPTGWEVTLPQAEGTAITAASMPEFTTPVDDLSTDQTPSETVPSPSATGDHFPQGEPGELGLGEDGIEDILSLPELTVPLGG